MVFIEKSLMRISVQRACYLANPQAKVKPRSKNGYRVVFHHRFDEKNTSFFGALCFLKFTSATEWLFWLFILTLGQLLHGIAVLILTLSHCISGQLASRCGRQKRPDALLPSWSSALPGITSGFGCKEFLNRQANIYENPVAEFR